MKFGFHRLMRLTALAGLCAALVSCRGRPPPPPPPPPLLPALAGAAPPPRSAGARQLGAPVEDFRRIAEWRVSSPGGDSLLLKVSADGPGGDPLTELQFVPRGPGAQLVTLLPREPWVIPSHFDTLLLWMWHPAPPGLREDHALRLIYRDARGDLGVWRLPYAPGPNWQMLHLRIPVSVPVPVRVERLEWELPDTARGGQRLRLDSLAVYQEVLSRIPQRVEYVRPHDYPPAFAPRRRNSVTLNFPPAPNAFRPQPRSERFLQSLEQEGPESFRFRYESTDDTIEYRVEAAPGGPRFSLRAGGRDFPDFWRNFGVKTGGAPPSLRYARRAEGLLHLQYTGGLQYIISLHGKTLQIEASSLLEQIESLDLGALSAADGGLPEILRFPLMRLSPEQRWPVFHFPGGDIPVFVSCFPDWWYSMAGSHRPLLSTPDRPGHSLGEMVYPVRWRGTRNMFRERMYLTASRRPEETLPSVAAPRAMHRTLRDDSFWSEAPETADAFAGMFPLRLHPLEAEWSDQLLARNPDGAWQEHPGGGYVIKSAFLNSFALDRVIRLRQQHDTALLVLPTLTQYPPWQFTDADLRALGAGTFTQTWADTGAMLQQSEAEWGGGVVGGGGSEWLWAGLVSALLPEFPFGLSELHPLLPHFAWRNVHPQSRVLGLGSWRSFQLPGETDPAPEILLDRLLALQVAYGAPGRLPEDLPLRLREKSRRIQEVLWNEIRDQELRRAAYWDGKRFLDTGEAAAAGMLDESQLYLRLSNDTEIWVNGDLFGTWPLRVDELTLTLPPFGFVIRGRDLRLIHLPGQGEGGGLCVLEQPETLWVSSPGRVSEWSGLRLQGCLQIRRGGEGKPARLHIRDWHGHARIPHAWLNLPSVGSLRALDAQGEEMRDVVVEREGDFWILRGKAGLHEVWLYPDIHGGDTKFSP